MDAAGGRRQVRELRRILQQRGAPTRQIAAVIAERFGVTPLMAFRYATGLTQAEVAELYNRKWPSDPPKTFKQVSYWECWQGPGSESSASARPPSYEDLVRLASLYRCLVDDLLLGPHRKLPLPPPEIGELLADVLSVVESDSYPGKADDVMVITFDVPTGEGTVAVKLSRREFTELLAAGGLAALVPGAASAEPVTASGTARGATYYRHILNAHQAGHHLLPPAAHLSVLQRELHGIEKARQETPGVARQELRRIQSEYAEHISWLLRESADLNGCRQWANRATTWAMEAGDTSMAAYMMIRTASLALDRKDHTRAMDLTMAVRNASWTIPPVLRGIAQAYEARGHALTGTVAAAHLDEATELITTGRTETDPPYLRFFTGDFADMQRATCYVDAGQPGRAVTILQSRITTMPTSHRRDRAVYLTRLGAAHAAAQEPDSAAFAGLGALTDARRSASEHVMTELDNLADTLMRQWPKQPQVRQLHEELRTARHSQLSGSV
ncbi:hypothetical protein [Streptosporangium saharense]|uniref:hypothetical protein n=1 Tax=Streptosporangium saharense TaxID=1706840 RepID=UPI003690A045